MMPTHSRAASYGTPDRAIVKLESIVHLSFRQEHEAYKIFDNLKTAMDALPATADKLQKMVQINHDARTAIRAILTPDQQMIYDRTPQRLGGGMTKADPAMIALQKKIHDAVINFARTSPAVAAQFGSVQSATAFRGHATTVSDEVGSSVRHGNYDTEDFAPEGDPAVHPASGSNLVRVTGANETAVIKVEWTMNSTGDLVVKNFEKLKA